ncbi:MAG: dipeptidase PepE [Candidatus Rokubacteria bacterium]|nr:dipeptidase PepE [Candidatus Rokubacteria bacterium]
MTRALLFSTTGGVLEMARSELGAFLGDRKTLAFVTAASLGDEVAYYLRMQASFAPLPPDGAGVRLLHLKWNDAPLATLARADAVFVGGGNTYALLERLREAKLLDAIRERVAAGMPYVGSSAGSNVAGPRILTTNDWNVVGLDDFGALGLVPFNINPHYLEADPAMAAHSETRDDRIREYHVIWSNPVLGIEEGAAVRVEDGVATVCGHARVKLFRRRAAPVWYSAGSRLPLD